MEDIFVLIDVGCIECGEETRLLGVWSSKRKAQAAFRREATKREATLDPGWAHEKSVTAIAGFSYFSGGQHSVEIHTNPTIP